MSSSKGRLAAWGFVMALALTVTSPAAGSAAFAADPVAPAADEGVSGAVVSGTPNEGLTQAQIDQKFKEVKDFGATRKGGHKPKKLGAGSKVNTTGGVSPSSVITDGSGHTVAVTIDYYPGFHQKTTYYCVPAVIQSIAYFDLDVWYRTMGAGSIRGAQDRLFLGYTDPRTGITYAALGSMAALAASDSKAMAWVNSQFRLSRYNYSFYYVADEPADLAHFQNDVMLDVWAYYEASYARIDLSKGTYSWVQGVGTNGKHPIHATLPVGYNDSTKYMVSYDPFAYRTASGACSHAYSAAPDWGCNWSLSSRNYFLTLDLSQHNQVWV